jgi:hypothetical protein
MRYFIDTEFMEAGGNDRHEPTIDLISIGVVCEDGREYYAISKEFDEIACSPWVTENVISLLPDPNDPLWKTRAAISQNLLDFIGPEPEFWGYYSSYDFVAFCWLFGTMLDLPKGWPKYCRDLKQWSDSIQAPKFPKDKGKEHNALADANWNKNLYGHLSLFESLLRVSGS